MQHARKASKPAPMSQHDLRRIAVEAGVDPRTVSAALEGRSHPVIRRAVLAAVKTLGMAVESLEA